MTASEIERELKRLSSKERKEKSLRFFKTGHGEYGERDKFLGATAPEMRKIAKQFYNIPTDETQELLSDKYNNMRWIGLIILRHQFEKADENTRKKIYNFYLKNLENINNWNLVDISAPHIVGDFLINKKDRNILYKLSDSDNLWKNRVAIVATLAFVKKGDFADTFKISEVLLQRKHDLIHKAVGWMLREVGKRDVSALENFLRHHYKDMPRTMLRYSIEKFPETKRQKYLKGKM